MTHDDQSFESDLQHDLKRLGQLAEGRIRLQDVLGHLRRRSMRRRVAGAAAIGLVAAACGVAIVSLSPGKRQRQDMAQPPRLPQEADRPLASALPITAGKTEVLDALARVVQPGQRMSIMKTERGDLSFVIAGHTALPPERIRRELETLFRDFEYVDLDRNPELLRYTLIARTTGKSPRALHERSFQ